jgi:hypothetical protein
METYAYRRSGMEGGTGLGMENESKSEVGKNVKSEEWEKGTPSVVGKKEEKRGKCKLWEAKARVQLRREKKPLRDGVRKVPSRDKEGRGCMMIGSEGRVSCWS